MTDTAEQVGRVGVWGASGSGKSSYVKRQLAKRNRVVIFDPQGEYDATQAQSVEAVRLEMMRNWSGFRIAYRPPPGAAGAAKGQSLRRVGSDGESMDRRSCFRPLKPLTACRQISGHFSRDGTGLKMQFIKRGVGGNGFTLCQIHHAVINAFSGIGVGSD